MKKLSKIQLAQVDIFWGYLKDFEHWPKSLDDTLAQWEIGFTFNRKSRKKDLLVVLNYLAEVGRISFETIEKPNGLSEIGFRITSGAK